MSGVTPQSTTARLAGLVQKAETRAKNSPGSSQLPGSFPETPANELSEFSVNPIPATSGSGNPVNLRPGEKVPDPSTLTSNTVSSTPRDDPSLSKSDDDSQQTFGVAPIPASSGIGNPVQLKAGEKVPDPSTFNKNTINSTVKTDKESYENTSGAPQLPDVVTPDEERNAKGGMFGLPSSMKNLIPESSLPMGQSTSSERDPGVTTQSAGPESTTASLAANVPLEPRGVPEIVQKSQAEAGFEPEASGNREAVKEKSEVEKELEAKVPEEPPITEGTGTGTNESEEPKVAGAADNEKDVPEESNDADTGKKGMSAGGAVGMITGGVGAAVATATSYMSKDKPSADTTSSSPRGIPQSVQQSIDEMNKSTPIASTVPDVVQESITKSHQSPEAAASKEMVKEKSAMEAQLMSYVTPEEGSGEKAPRASDGISDQNTGLSKSAIAPGVPDVVRESIMKSHQSPEAAGNKEMVEEKSAMESQLRKIASTEDESGEVAPTHNAAVAGSAIAPTVPDVVQESIAESHQSPEAAGSREMVKEKSAMESELLKTVRSEDGAGEPAPTASAALYETAPAPTPKTEGAGLTAPATAPAPTSMTEDTGLNAPAAAPATTPATQNAAVRDPDSRDVSPMSRTPGQTSQAQPMVTSGIGATSVPQTSQAPPTPQKDMPSASTPPKAMNTSSKTAESSASTDKKSKRASGFFGKLRSKFSDKDKK